VDKAQRNAIIAAALSRSDSLGGGVAEELAARLGCGVATVYREAARQRAARKGPALQLHAGREAPVGAVPEPVDLPAPAVDLAALPYEEALGVLANSLTRFLSAERGDWASGAARTIKDLLAARHELAAPKADGLSVDAAAAAAELERLRAQLPAKLRRALEGAA
jgi:hypothetical protein